MLACLDVDRGRPRQVRMRTLKCPGDILTYSMLCSDGFLVIKDSALLSAEFCTLASYEGVKPQKLD